MHCITWSILPDETARTKCPNCHKLRACYFRLQGETSDLHQSLTTGTEVYFPPVRQPKRRIWAKKIVKSQIWFCLCKFIHTIKPLIICIIKPVLCKYTSKLNMPRVNFLAYKQQLYCKQEMDEHQHLNTLNLLTKIFIAYLKKNTKHIFNDQQNK